MLAFIILISIKIKLNLSEILTIASLTILNQFIADIEINTQVKFIAFIVNLFNLKTIYLGQNHEAAHFSIFSFLIQYGSLNPLVNIKNPFALNLILVNLIFGPTIYELL